MKPDEKKAPRNGKKPYRKPNSFKGGQRKQEFTEGEDFRKGKANDPGWYTKVGQLTSDVATISFNNPVGAPISLGVGESVGVNPLRTPAIPGIFVIHTIPAAGTAPDTDPGASAINIAAQNLYSNLRSWNSGSANYDRADLMVYILAMDSVFSFWAWMTRIYGVARIFSHTNRYIGDALIRAMGVDPISIRKNLADFRAYINGYALKASTFAVPNVMSLFTRHVWMYSSIFMDENVQKAQLYMYNPASLWRFGIHPTNGSGMLATQPVGLNYNSTSGSFVDHDTLRSMTAIVTVGDNILNAIYTDEDAGIISGDIIKAYGVSNLWKFQEIGLDYTVLPIFSEEVLTQIHNTRFASGVIKKNEDTTLSINVYQNPDVNRGNLIFTPKFGKQARLLAYDAILDTWKESPSADDVIVATRNMTYATVVGVGDDAVTHLISCGSEICLYADIYFFDSSMNLTKLSGYTYPEWFNLMDQSIAISKFNEYPHFIYCTSEGTPAGIVGELSNYTILTGAEIMKMNESAILSQLAVPYFGVSKAANVGK